MLAQLADPTTRGQVDASEKVDWGVVCKTLVKNKIPLVSFLHDEGFKTCPLSNVPEFNWAAGEEEAVWSALREEYSRQESPLKSGIECILLKLVGFAPSFPYTSDNLDVLIRPENIKSGA